MTWTDEKTCLNSLHSRLLKGITVTHSRILVSSLWRVLLITLSSQSDIPSLTTVALDKSNAFKHKKTVHTKSISSSSPSFLDITPALQQYLSSLLSFTHSPFSQSERLATITSPHWWFALPNTVLFSTFLQTNTNTIQNDYRERNPPSSVSNVVGAFIESLTCHASSDNEKYISRFLSKQLWGKNGKEFPLLPSRTSWAFIESLICHASSDNEKYISQFLSKQLWGKNGKNSPFFRPTPEIMEKAKHHSRRTRNGSGSLRRVCSLRSSPHWSPTRGWSSPSPCSHGRSKIPWWFRQSSWWRAFGLLVLDVQLRRRLPSVSLRGSAAEWTPARRDSADSAQPVPCGIEHRPSRLCGYKQRLQPGVKVPHSEAVMRKKREANHNYIDSIGGA